MSKNWAWMSLILCGASIAAPVQTTVSEEDVPVYLDDVKNIVCRDLIPDHGFGQQPGALSIETKHLFDRTLRVTGAEALYVELPDTVTCTDLRNALNATPKLLPVHRQLVRNVENTLDNKRKVSRLIAHLTLTLPAKIDDKNIALHGEQGWVEDNSPADDQTVGNKPFPITSSFVALTHPQSATDTVGLACKPPYEGAPQNWLTLGELDGYSTLGWVQSNSSILHFPTARPGSCEERKAALLDFYTAEDPGNWGTLLKVERTLELRHRYILDNEARQTCQEIEVETVTTDVRGQIFRANAAFPLRTLPLQDCLPAK